MREEIFEIRCSYNCDFFALAFDGSFITSEIKSSRNKNNRHSKRISDTIQSDPRNILCICYATPLV